MAVGHPHRPLWWQLAAENFRTTLPAVFELPVNLTDGWVGGVPVHAPVGMRGELPATTWAVSPCRATKTICNAVSYVQGRPQNGSWCSGPGSDVAATKLLFYAARHNLVEFRFASADATSVTSVAVRCDPSLDPDTLVPDPAMSEVVATGAGTGRVQLQINLTSRCACDGECVPHPTRPYHDKGDGLAAIDPGHPADYPVGSPGRSTFNGTSCGRGVELVDCKRACDAATQPQCTSITFTAGAGMCFLFANGGCATYSKAGSTTYWDSQACPAEDGSVALNSAQ